MSSLAHGNSTSAVEVTHISIHGIWILAHGKEHFLAYEKFPWFKDQPHDVLEDVEEPSPGHFFWPKLDVDLTVDIIEHPENFPLEAK